MSPERKYFRARERYGDWAENATDEEELPKQRKKAIRLFEDTEPAEDADFRGKKRENTEGNPKNGKISKSPNTEKSEAVAYAMRLAATDALTEKRLKDKLESRGYSTDEISEAAEYLRRFGYLNDARLAQNSLEKLASRCWGKYKICRYLAAKGIDSEIIEGLDFSEIDFPYHCARLMRKYTPERRDAMLRAVKNAGYTSSDLRMARQIIEEED
ncbi:MAG: regulatory protein RecX [Clostridia bacterium]|nr:regulatory protein RecX [Clostridia bacterium]